jgi:hypothetical protein
VGDIKDNVVFLSVLMREYLIFEQARILGHAPRAATGAETAALTAKSDQAFLVAGFTAHAEKAIFQSTALQVVFELPLHVVGQYPAFLGLLLPEYRVVFRHQLIEKRTLGLDSTVH